MNDSGSVCVSSMSEEDLSCKYAQGENEIVFELDPGVIPVGEEIEVCFSNNCQYKINGPEKEPIHVYFNNLNTNTNQPEIDDLVSENASSPEYLDNGGNQIEGSRSNDNGQYVYIIGIPLFLGLVIWIWLRGRGRYERRSFPTYVKKEVLQKQGYRCILCKKSAGVWDFDHIDGDRTNNDISNCQALRPNCHAKKTRGLIKYERHKTSFKKIAFVIIILLFIFLILYTYATAE